jgi:hypothetical protein
MQCETDARKRLFDCRPHLSIRFPQVPTDDALGFVEDISRVVRLEAGCVLKVSLGPDCWTSLRVFVCSGNPLGVWWPAEVVL